MISSDWPPLDGIDPQDALTMWTIHDRPNDFPDFWVVKRCFIVRGYTDPVMDVVPRLAVSLAEARSFVPWGLFCQPRQEGDDPFIVETWF